MARGVSNHEAAPMFLPAGGDRGRPVLRDGRYARVEFWVQFVPARPQDEAEHWATPISRLISENAVTSRLRSRHLEPEPRHHRALFRPHGEEPRDRGPSK